MTRLAIGLALALLLMVGTVGCSATSAPIMPETPTAPPAISNGAAPPTASGSPSSVSDPDVEARLVDRTWISPAMVQVSNYYPGARAEWSLRLHNGRDTKAEFLVSYRQPDYVKEGYDKAPVAAQDWVIIADPTPVLAPKETKEILIALAMPDGAKIESRQWEFWVSATEKTGGMVQTEMCSRWLVTMR